MVQEIPVAPIEYCQKVKERGFKIKKGTKDDTILLNTNFKTILVLFFR